MRTERIRAVCGLLVVLAIVGRPASALEDPRNRALRLLHDGRFDAADGVLEGAEVENPSPSVLFFRAFATYWRLLYDEDDASLQEELERRLDRAIEVAERVGANGDGGEASLWEGSARLLLAELEAHRKHLFAAAFEARRARRALEVARERGGAGVEPLFGLGLYDYVADQVPSFVKGLRALLFLPGGNRDRGLERLHRAATGSRYFGLESRLLLVTIYSGKEERLFEEARTQAEAAATLSPPSVAGLLASGRIELDLADTDRAIERLDAALARSSGFPDTAPSVLGELYLQRARADFARFRPDLAREIVSGRLVPLASRLPAETCEDADRLVEACDALTGAGIPGWEASLPALEIERASGVVSSLPSIGAVAAERPDDPVVALLFGRALLAGGEGERALALLERAAADPGLPTAWRGPARLLAGRAADLCGKRPLALSHYREAAQGPSFIGKDAAVHHQRIAWRGR